MLVLVLVLRTWSCLRHWSAPVCAWEFPSILSRADSWVMGSCVAVVVQSAGCRRWKAPTGTPGRSWRPTSIHWRAPVCVSTRRPDVRPLTTRSAAVPASFIGGTWVVSRYLAAPATNIRATVRSVPCFTLYNWTVYLRPCPSVPSVSLSVNRITQNYRLLVGHNTGTKLLEFEWSWPKVSVTTGQKVKIVYIYSLSQKQDTLLLPIINFANVDRFYKFFYRQTQH